MDIKRLIRHLATPRLRVRALFPPAALAAITRAVQAAEQRQCGELRVIIEGALPLAALRRGLSARARAGELFRRSGVGRTAERNGVLIYLQVADRRIEIIADRGIAAVVPDAAWQEICDALGRALRAGEPLPGVLAAIEQTTALLAQHFPATAGPAPNELPDAPQVL